MNTETLFGACALVTTTVVTVGCGIVLQTRELRRIEQRTSALVDQAQSKLASNLNKSQPAWDLARITLESYFQRNLSQISCIFWLSATVMAVGFCIVLWGITQAVVPPTTIGASQEITPANLGILTGLISQFIGGSFLLLYRSVLGQASHYAQTLERINSIGMAMQIMDTLPDAAQSTDMKSQAKVNIAQLLVQQSYQLSSNVVVPPNATPINSAPTADMSASATSPSVLSSGT